MDDPAGRDLVRRHVGDVAAVDDDGAVAGLLRAADGAQEGRLARAVGAQQGHDLAVLDVEVNVEKHLEPVIEDVDAAADKKPGLALFFEPACLLAGGGGKQRVATITLEEIGGGVRHQAAEDEERQGEEEHGLVAIVLADQRKDGHKDVPGDGGEVRHLVALATDLGGDHLAVHRQQPRPAQGAAEVEHEHEHAEQPERWQERHAAGADDGDEEQQSYYAQDTARGAFAERINQAATEDAAKQPGDDGGQEEEAPLTYGEVVLVRQDKGQKDKGREKADIPEDVGHEEAPYRSR